MNMKKNSFNKMILFHFIIGLITLITVKVYEPKYNTVGGIISSLVSRETSIMFVTMLVVGFVLYSFITLSLGLHITYSRTIGKMIHFIKNIFIKDTFYNDDYDEEYTYLDIIIITAYILLIIPIMLYIILPTFLSILAIVLGACLLLSFLK